MITLPNTNSIETIIRAALIAQSGLNGKFVRNSLSLHGEALEKVLSEQIYTSIDGSDSLMLFELQSRQNDADMSETEDDESISYYKSFKIYVIIYGDNSTNLANTLSARFRTERVRRQLQSEGLYLETISDSQKINEYKNETMWIRNDIEIDISCHLSIQPTTNDDTLDTLNDITIDHI